MATVEISTRLGTGSAGEEKDAVRVRTVFLP